MNFAKQIATLFLAAVAFFSISCSDKSSEDNPIIPIETTEESSSSSSSVILSEVEGSSSSSSKNVILSSSEGSSSSSSKNVILSSSEGSSSSSVKSSSSSAKSSSSSSRHSGLDPESSSSKIASSSSSSRNDVNSSSSSAKSSSSIKPSSSSIAKPSSSSKNVILSSSEGSSSSSSQAKSNSSVKSSSSSAKSSSSSSRHSGLDPESSSSKIASSSSSSRNDVNSSSSSVKSSSSKSLNGKVWYIIGDSFSTGDAFSDLDPIPTITNGKYAGQRSIYPYLIGNRTGCDVQNKAVSGTTISYVNNNGFTKPDNGLLYRTNFSNADIITIYYGINDSHNSVPIGNINDTDPSTFYGAYNTVIEHLSTNYPNAKIGIIISNGCDSPDYPDATEKIANKWGLPYLDIDGGVNGITMLRSSSRNPASKEEKKKALLEQRVSETNWHPNAYAHELESHFIEEWLKTLF